MENLLNIDYNEFKELKSREVEEENDATDTIIPPPDIIAFTEQRSCADIYRMYEKKHLDINSDFQRGEVWTNRAQTLFVDSLIKQLPIPSMCISLDIKSQKRIVIDGLQRITTIIKFLDESKEWKLSNTPDVDKRISGKKTSEIKDQYSEIYDSVENITIPITVIRCDFENRNHMNYLFQIFYRLNTGGNKLYNQEIRNCIYQGPLNKMLKDLAVSPLWLVFNGTTPEKVKSSRYGNEEKILRFFAFYYRYESYNGKLASFLNDFMGENSRLPEQDVANYTHLFNSTLELANKLSEKPNSKNVADAILVGLAINREHLLDKGSSTLSNLYSQLMACHEFSQEELKEGLGATEKVKNRIQKSIEIFGRD